MYNCLYKFLNCALKNNQETWLPHFQFQSHEPEFDFLKSIELEGKINQIRFCHPSGNNNMLLSTNGMFVNICVAYFTHKCDCR